MSGLCTRLIAARRVGACVSCEQHIEPGDPIAPAGDGGWTCGACEAGRDPLDRLTRWLAYYVDAIRTPPLDAVDAHLLVDELNRCEVIASRRGDRRAWHTRSPRVATLAQPFLEDAHGLLVDALDHHFPPRLPAPGITAILEALYEPVVRPHVDG